MFITKQMPKLLKNTDIDWNLYNPTPFVEPTKRGFIGLRFFIQVTLT